MANQASDIKSLSVCDMFLGLDIEYTPRASRCTDSRHWQSNPITAGRSANFPSQAAFAMRAHTLPNSDKSPDCTGQVTCSSVIDLVTTQAYQV